MRKVALRDAQREHLKKNIERAIERPVVVTESAEGSRTQLAQEIGYLAGNVAEAVSRLDRAVAEAGAATAAAVTATARAVTATAKAVEQIRPEKKITRWVFEVKRRDHAGNIEKMEARGV